MDMIPTRHEVTGHEAEFPEETIPAWRQRGWIPLSELDESAEAAAEEPSDTKPRPARQRTASTEEPTP